MFLCRIMFPCVNLSNGPWKYVFPNITHQKQLKYKLMASSWKRKYRICSEMKTPIMILMKRKVRMMNRIVRMKKRIVRMKKRIVRMKKRIVRMKKRIVRMKKRIVRMKKRIVRMKKRIVRMMREIATSKSISPSAILLLVTSF